MYCQTEDLKLLCAEKELVQMVKDGAGQGWDHAHVQAALAEAIDHADGEIDAYLGARMDVPLETVPRIISNTSAKIAVYNLMRRRASVPDHWQSEYKRCLDLLKAITSGKISLGLSEDGSSDAGTTAHDAVVIAPKRMFGSDVWEKF